LIDLNQFYKWQREDPENRNVKIEIGGRFPDWLEVYVYDHELMAGQIVNSVEEIDLVGAHERREREEFDRLLKKFGKKECHLAN